MAAAAKTIPHDEFTVAWICALPLEMAAAEAMLDEKYQELPTDPRDQNTYILGRIKSHNIVIACLPNGVYGTISAAVLASQIQHTFQLIRYSLMVGIGGGVPSKSADIRLGDVVVSRPTRDFGGVIQYDYGKTVNEGSFQRTGMLNKPPPILLTAISKMQAKHILRCDQLSSHLIKASVENPSSSDMFTYCGIEQDILFHSAYDHPDPEKSCESCDRKRIVQRLPRANNHPVVHYGLVASGDQVMKHAPTRDTLAKDLGVLCFEMEASGLMDNFPCLVIRGICDYADSHKTKQWQKYAAATAAAYAKELLCLIHPSWSSQMPVANSLINLNPYFRNLQRRTAEPLIQGWRQDEGVGRLLRHISSYDHEKVHQRLSRKKLEGTTQWFTDHPSFQGWFEKKQFPCLWCTGKIGSGKTIITSTVVEMAKCRAEHGTLTVFFYCGEAYSEHQAKAIMSSFVKQICEYLFSTSKPIPQYIQKEVMKFFGERQAKPDFEDMENIFTNLFSHVPNTIYVLDGLELVEPNEVKCLLRCFKSLFCGKNSSYKSQILLVSREQVQGFIDITTFFPGIQTISTSSNVMQDIELYIKEGIADKMMMRRLTDDTKLLNEMERILLTKSSGMFLWVFLQIEIIWDTCFMDTEIRSALQALPKNLEETYRRCVHRINLRDTRNLKALTWVSFANKPLHIEELREAVAFSLQDTSWDGEQLPRIDFILGSCANLITMDPTDYSIHFAHSSVKQYLAKDCELLPGYPQDSIQGDLRCGEFCITYLSFSDFSLQLDRPQKLTASLEVPNPLFFAQEAIRFGFNRRLLGTNGNQRSPTSISFNRVHTYSNPDRMKYRFPGYAIENWALHTRHITEDSSFWDKFQRLATTFSETWNFHPWVPSSRAPLSQIHAIFGWAVKEQHVPLLSMLSACRSELQQVCNIPLSRDSLPALHVASKLGHQTIVRILLDICDINRQDRQGCTALHYAAAKGHTLIVRMLTISPDLNILSDKANIETRDSCHRTPLIHAAKGGHLEVVEFLVSHGADTEARDLFGFTPVSWAIKEQHWKIISFFFRYGSRLGAKSAECWKILLEASKAGDEVLVRRMLMVKPAYIEASDIDWRTSLSWAAGNGHFTVAKLLIEIGANVGSRDINGKSPLIWASRNEHGAITSLLIQTIANNNIMSLQDIPRENQRIRWSGYMMDLTGFETSGWRYFVLHEDSLTVHKSWDSVSRANALRSYDIYDYTPTLASPNIFWYSSEDSREKASKASVGHDNQLYHFFLCENVHTFGDDAVPTYHKKSTSTRRLYHFAVTTEQERVDWMREIAAAVD